MECISLIQAMHNIINFMVLMKDILFLFNIYIINPEVFCKVFEDNKSSIAVSESFFQQEQNTLLLSIII